MSHCQITSIRAACVAASVLALLSFAASDAAAQGQPAPPPMEAAASGSSASFLTIDRGDGSSFANVSLATSFFEGEDPDFNMRLDLYGQYVSNGTGGYLALPVSYLSDNDDSATAIGNIEIGGLHNLQLNPNTNLVLRGGITLPTASDDFDKLLASVANLNARYTDVAGVVPEFTIVRLAASPVHRTGQVFLRADGGIDLPIAAPDGAEKDPILRMNLAAGFFLGEGSVALEVVTLAATDVDDGEERFVHTIAFSGRFNLGNAELFGGLIVPAGSENDFVDMTLVAGARIPLNL